jgi:hypothetical protein
LILIRQRGGLRRGKLSLYTSASGIYNYITICDTVLTDILFKLYCGLKSVRIPGIKKTLFYIRVDDFLLVLLSSIAKQLSASVSRVNKFNKKLLDLLLVLNKTIIPL